MTKSIVINPQNLCEQKISTLFWSVLEDIDKVTECGIKINMIDWANVNGNNCTVCLGGAAVLGFVGEREINSKVVNQVSDVINLADTPRRLDGINLSKKEKRDMSDMATMFNSFREGNYRSAILWYNRFSNIEIPDSFKVVGRFGIYNGSVSGQKLIKLKESIKSFATYLEINGY